MSKTNKQPALDVSLIDDALSKSPYERFKEACDLYAFYESCTPYKKKHLAKSFDSFEEYEKWKKTIDDPRYW